MFLIIITILGVGDVNDIEMKGYTQRSVFYFFPRGC